jgi:hypothetical protein
VPGGTADVGAIPPTVPAITMADLGSNYARAVAEGAKVIARTVLPRL